ncbi:MAG: T9SS type A sorting domain-containing protein, partial [Chitinophagaceae bacterium]
PNPASQVVNVALKSEIKEVLAISVFNTTGQLIVSQEYQPGGSITIPVATWAKGIYFLYLKSESGSSYRKLIVQ